MVNRAMVVSRLGIHSLEAMSTVLYGEFPRRAMSERSGFCQHAGENQPCVRWNFEFFHLPTSPKLSLSGGHWKRCCELLDRDYCGRETIVCSRLKTGGVLEWRITLAARVPDKGRRRRWMDLMPPGAVRRRGRRWGGYLSYDQLLAGQGGIQERAPWLSFLTRPGDMVKGQVLSRTNSAHPLGPCPPGPPPLPAKPPRPRFLKNRNFEVRI